MDMGIVNAGQLGVYEQLDPALRTACEDVVLNRRADATERLLEIAARFKGDGGARRHEDLEWRKLPVNKRLEHALVKGIDDYIIEDTEAARSSFERPRAHRPRRLGVLDDVVIDPLDERILQALADFELAPLELLATARAALALVALSLIHI